VLFEYYLMFINLKKFLENYNEYQRSEATAVEQLKTATKSTVH